MNFLELSKTDSYKSLINMIGYFYECALNMLPIEIDNIDIDYKLLDRYVLNMSFDKKIIMKIDMQDYYTHEGVIINENLAHDVNWRGPIVFSIYENGSIPFCVDLLNVLFLDNDEHYNKYNRVDEKYEYRMIIKLYNTFVKLSSVAYPVHKYNEKDIIDMINKKEIEISLYKKNKLDNLFKIDFANEK